MSEIIEKEHEEMEEKVVEDLSQLELTSDSEHSSDDYSTTTPIKSKKFNTVGELKKEMSKLGLSLKGNKEELKKRYKKYIKKQEEKEKNM